MVDFTLLVRAICSCGACWAGQLVPRDAGRSTNKSQPCGQRLLRRLTRPCWTSVGLQALVGFSSFFCTETCSMYAPLRRSGGRAGAATGYILPAAARDGDPPVYSALPNFLLSSPGGHAPPCAWAPLVPLLRWLHSNQRWSLSVPTPAGLPWYVGVQTPKTWLSGFTHTTPSVRHSVCN